MAVQFLTSLERLRYEQIPASVSEEEINHHFYFSESDLNLIAAQRSNENQFAFAVQLGIIRFMGYLPDNWQTTVPDRILDKISGQLEIDKSSLVKYGARAATKTEHLQTILRCLGFSKWAPLDIIPLENWLLERALEHDKPTLLLDLACEKLILQKILRPSIGTLERMVVMVRVKAYEETYARLNAILTSELKVKLDDILIHHKDNRNTVFARLKEESNANTPLQINKSLLKYSFLIEIGTAQWDLTLLNPNRKKFLAQKARRSTNQELQRMKAEKRYPLLIAFLHQSLTDITDSVLDMYKGFLEDIYHKSKRELAEYQQKTAQAKDQAMSTLNQAAALLIDEENITDENIRNYIFSKIPKVELKQAVMVTNELLHPTRNSFLSFLDNYYPRIRQFSSNFLNTLTFQSPIENDNFLYAVSIVRRLQSGLMKKSRTMLL